MNIIRAIPELRRVCDDMRRQGETIGFVPTMGALHTGHLSLVERAKQASDRVVVSIFVNPTQFGPQEDFSSYPRPEGQDRELCQKAGVDILFLPDAKEIYPDPFFSAVFVEKLTDGLCGPFRPGHFRGVCTIVAQLFNMVGPCSAFFGEKDYQQLQVLRRMVQDLKFPVSVIACPTIRESDGLALSSRNARLNPQERPVAARLFQALQAIKEVYRQRGEVRQSDVQTICRQIIEQGDLARIQYAELVHLETLAPLDHIGGGSALVALAVFVGKTRLIDNLVL